MARGDFAKAFSEHRRTGGKMTRLEFGKTYRLINKMPIEKTNEKKVEDDDSDGEEYT